MTHHLRGGHAYHGGGTGEKRNTPKPTERQDAQILPRHDVQVIKGLLEPGVTDLDRILAGDAERIRALGVNTIYVYADYSYENGEFVLSSKTGNAFPKPTQNELEQAHIDNVIKAKEAGFAVHLATAFGGGRNQPFNVTLERFLADAREADITWAALAEKYQVESFAPSSEIDFQIFREYYNADWNSQAKQDEAARISNKYHDEVLPEIRKAFKGRVIYQAGLWNPLLGSKGYDLFGTGLNNVGAELAGWREQAKRVYGYAETNAKRQGSGWMVTEFWAPIREQGEPNKETKLLYTRSGVAYDEIQHEFYKIAIEEYLKWNGDIKPSGFAFTQYSNPSAPVKDRPAEELIKDFYNQLR